MIASSDLHTNSPCYLAFDNIRSFLIS